MDNIRLDEAKNIILKKIESFHSGSDLEETGSVLSVGDGGANVYGLDQVMVREQVGFADGSKGVVLSLEQNHVGVAILSGVGHVCEGDSVKRLKSINAMPVGEALLGRVLDAKGDPLDGLGAVATTEYATIEVKAPGIVDRQSVYEPLQTGLKCVDSMTPIGRGQRELIVGDRQTGKTTIAIDTILNQKGQGVICIYVAIGQKSSTIAQIVERLKVAGALSYTTIISAPSTDPAALQFLAPYSGISIAEWFMAQGKHCLIVYDDLSKQAVAYRELSLLLRRSPGREAYPGDVFYIHSRLLERACKLSEAKGGGSITALPIVETQAGDISAYVPTNVISITDGQIFLESDLFFSGVRPAVNAGQSVSRVGGAAQLPAMKKVSGTVRLELAQYRELEAFAQFGSDLDATTQQTLKRGKVLVQILKQPQYSPLHIGLQVAILYAATRGYLDNYELSDLQNYEMGLYGELSNNHASWLDNVASGAPLKDDVEGQLKTILNNYGERFVSECQT
ncbi:MAG: F0F1 ATP synthase subunit alpha [Proteobacteria bacterium]|nr:F0F1 ATP synthase subunit alpha [Pseudomonadota bacterium]